MRGTIELRSSPRVPLVLSVKAEHLNSSTANMSEGGLFIETEEPFERGQSIRLTLSFPGLLDPLEVSGVVVWRRRRDGSEPGGIGVAISHDEQARHPRLHELVQAAFQPLQPTLPPAEPFRILIVDDSPNSAELYGYAVRRLATPDEAEPTDAISVDYARDGMEALELLRAKRHALLVTDLYMPGVDGFALIQRVRADASLRATRILVVSGGESEAFERAMDLGADGLVQKPARVDDLVFTVRTLLQLQLRREGT